MTDPAVEGRVLYQERSVRSKKDDALWFARRHVWVTDREMILHLRADYGSRRGFRTRRYGPRQIARVLLEGGGVRMDLVNAGETRTFLFQPRRPQALLRAVGTLIERADAGESPTPQ